MFIQPHDPDYVPEPMYPEYIPLEDEHVLPAEKQPLPPIDSPTAESPGYFAKSDPEEDPEEYEDDKSEDGLIDYPVDEGDDGDDNDSDSSRDDANDKDEDEDEEEEHLASADATVVVPNVNLVSLPEGTEPVIPPPSTDITTTGARITIRLQASISLPPEVEVDILLAMPTPPPSPLTSLSPPSARECLARCTASSAHSSPPPVPSPSLLSSGCPTLIQALRIASTQARIDTVIAALPSPLLPPPLYIPPPIDHRDDIPETELPSCKKLCLFSLGSRVIELAEIHKHDTQDLYALLEDAQDSRTRISQRVTMDSQRVDLLIKDRITHQETILIVKEEAYASREAWAHSIRLSHAVHYELQTHREQVYAHESRIQAHQTQLQRQSTLIQTHHQEILKKKMTNKYCPHDEIKKLEIELWNLKVKENDVPTYTDHFQELTLICTKFVVNETKKINKYISGLPNNIYESVKASKPKMLYETIELANDLMDQKLRTYEERQTDNKRKVDDSSRNNHGHQQHPSKRQNVANVYNIGSVKRKANGGTCPSSPSAIFITMARVLIKTTNVTRDNKKIPKGNGCFECGASGHFKRDCPKLKNKNEESVNAQGWVYAVGNAEKKGNASRDPDSNVVMGTFLLNNRYASILFDTGADRSFMSTAFSSLIDIVLTPLENSYDVELADGKIIGIFLAQISAKKEEDKSEEKQLKDVSIV
nr:hypothetical protein [Tanacetum cinerariifolium]